MGPQIFLHQGTGDLTLCWDLIKTACRLCIDIGLETTFIEGGSLSEEEFYCFAWCYMLDKNYTFKLGRSVPLLNFNLEMRTLQLQIDRHSMTENILLNMELAEVQAMLIPYLGNSPSNRTINIASFHDIGQHILVQINQIQARIDEVSGLVFRRALFPDKLHRLHALHKIGKA